VLLALFNSLTKNICSCRTINPMTECTNCRDKEKMSGQNAALD